MDELDSMVDTMEEGGLPLEELISKYERGAELINYCESILTDAKKRLDLITITPKPSDSGEDEPNTDASEEAETSSNNSNDDEIRLF